MSTSELRYPIGPFEFGIPVSLHERELYLEQVAEAPARMRTAVAGLSDEQLDTRIAAAGRFAKWSTTFPTRT
jgi:hypothetical protein